MFDFATPEYLTTFGVTMREGRWISDQDRNGTAPVVVVNETLAKLGWPDGRAVGGCLQMRDTTPCLTVIGIVRDFRVTGGVEGDMTPVYYLPFAQTAPLYARPPKLFVRLREESPALRETVRRAVQATASDAPSVSAHFLRANISWITTPLRLGAAVFTVFGVLAAIIAAVGLGGVLSSLVAQQHRAYAIRVALGAPNQRIVLPVLARALGVIVVGLAVGIVALVPLRRIIEPLLFHTSLIDVPVVGVALLGIIVAVVATVAPIRSILRIQPMRVLREE